MKVCAGTPLRFCIRPGHRRCPLPAPRHKAPEHDRHAEERFAHVEDEGFPDDVSPLDGETTEICYVLPAGR